MAFVVVAVGRGARMDGVVFSDFDSAPVAKFLKPDPDLIFFQT